VETPAHAATLEKRVPLGEAEQTQDLLGGWAPTLSLLEVQRQLFDVLAPHRSAQLALDEHRHEQCEEVEREECLWSMT
jgi:hypothetical protein